MRQLIFIHEDAFTHTGVFIHIYLELMRQLTIHEYVFYIQVVFIRKWSLYVGGLYTEVYSRLARVLYERFHVHVCV